MIIRFIVLAILAMIFITSSDPYYGFELSSSYRSQEVRDEVKEVSWLSPAALRPYLLDHKDRVDDRFAVNEFYYPNVQFWFLMYTKFKSSHVAIHDKNNLSLIYKVLDFSSLREKKLPPNTIHLLQQKISEEKMDLIYNDLIHLAKNPYSLEARAKDIYRALSKAGIQMPGKKSERIKFFYELTKSLRSQTGQKDFIEKGLAYSLPYRGFIQNYFLSKNLPVELLAIPFLESSFNPEAHSRVSALGVWQFMPLIASYFVPKRNSLLDYRSSVGVSSVAAAFLMEENFKIMKSWDLAITAYNSGTKHLVKSKRELASNSVDLEAIIKHSDSAHFGFASKNFYSEFLALAHTLAYQNELFPAIHPERADFSDNLKFFISKCPLRLDKVLTDEQLDDVNYHNHHLKSFDRIYPRGLIITTKSSMPAGKFFEINGTDLIKLKPIDWNKLIASQSCSTK